MRMILCIVTTFLLIPLSAQAQSDCGIIKVGWIDWPPYQMADSDNSGKPNGIDIEIADMELKKIGCKPTYLNKPWKRLIRELQDGDIDRLAGMSVTKERQQFALFSSPYRTETLTLFVRTEDSHDYNFKNLKEFFQTRFRLGVPRGAYHGEEFIQLSKSDDKKLILVDRVGGENLKLILIGWVVGYILDHATGLARIKTGTFQGIISPYPDVQVDFGTIHFMLNPNSLSSDLLATFNRNIDEAYQLSENQ